MAGDDVAFTQQSFIDLGRGISRYSEELRGFARGRQPGARPQAAVENRRFQLAIKRSRTIARSLGRRIEADFEQQIRCAGARRVRVAQLFFPQVALQRMAAVFTIPVR